MIALSLQHHASSRDFYRSTYRSAIKAEIDLPVIGAAMLLTRQDDGDWSDAATPDLVISTLKSGSVTATIDLGAGRFRRRRPVGGLLVVAPGSGSRIDAQGGHNVLSIDIPYRPLLALAPELELPPDGDFGHLHADYVRDPVISSILDRVWDEGHAPDTSRVLFLETALTCLVACLDNASRSAAPAHRTGGLTPRQMRLAVDWMTACPQYRISLSDLAAAVGLSPFHFLRSFKTSFGTTPHEYLLNLRMERAEDLLQTSRLSVTEIAFEVGYESSQSLARSFHRRRNMTPTAWRRRYRA